MLRVAFFGSPEFAVPALQKLLADERFTVALVVTRPDRPTGRGMKLLPTPVKQAALPPLQIFENIPAVSDLQKASVGKIVVVAYGRMIPPEIIQRWECINLHPSLLPQYRGPSPLQSALLNGDSKTGLTTMLINEKMDAGDILLQEELAVDPNLKLSELSRLCAARGAELLVQTLLADIQKLRRPQDEALATYCRKITKEDALIKPGESFWQIHNKARAVGACLTHRGKRVKILETSYLDGRLEILTVQPEGKTPMAYADFKNGYGALQL